MTASDLQQRFYPESRFGGFSDVDGTIAFYTRIHALLDEGMTVLDMGCGRGSGVIEDSVDFRRKLRNLRGRCHKIVGVDVDPGAAENPGLDEFRLIGDTTKWPVDDESIDLVICDFVLEHVADPDSFFDELARVLKPGGCFCARTSNRHGYVGVASTLLPDRFHHGVLRKVQPGREAQDIFPAFYRVNSLRRLRKALERIALQGIAYGYEAEPAYLGFSALAYRLGMVLHAWTPSPLRSCLFVYARKPGRTTET